MVERQVLHMDYLKTKGIKNYFSFYGKGGASTALLEYLGIGETEKDIVLTLLYLH